MAEVQQLTGQTQGMGICDSARTLSRIYLEAGNLLKRCPTLDPTGQDADAYLTASRQAQDTADAACQ
jgi:hypothetical protein